VLIYLYSFVVKKRSSNSKFFGLGNDTDFINISGTKSACLTLPAGRHVLRFVYNSPLGYHVHICSATKFIFGDEDAIMLPLKDVRILVE